MRVRRLLLALVAAGVLAAPSLAQPSEPEASAPSADAPEPLGIPPDQVTARAAQVDQLLRRVAEGLAPLPAIVEIEAELPELTARLGALQRDSSEALEAPESLQILDDVESQWLVEGDHLDRRSELLEDRLGKVRSWADELEAGIEVWKETSGLAREEGAPTALRAKIRETLGSLEATRKALTKRRNELLDIETQLSSLSRIQAEGISAVLVARSKFRASLLVRDGPNFLTAWSDREGSAAERAREVLAQETGVLRKAVRENAERAVVHGVVFLALAFLLVRLRQRAAEINADDETLQISMVVFERPFSAAMLVAVLSTPFFYPRLPSVAIGLNFLLFLVPVVRILPRLVDAPLRPAVYALAAFILVDQARELLVAVPTLSRLLIAIEVAAGIGLLVWMLRPSRLSALPAGARLHRGLSLALRLALAGLVVALVAGLAGWIRLCELLGEGILNSAAIALVTYGCWRVARSLLRVGVRSEAAQRLDLFRFHGWRLARSASRLLGAIALVGWAIGALRAFGIFDGVMASAASVLAASFTFGEVTVSLGDVVSFAVTLTISIALARSLRFLLDVELLPRSGLQPGAAHALSVTTGYVVLLLGFFLAASAAGVDFNRFTLLAGALGVGVGFGLQNIVNNFVSGLILLFERPVQLGDQIELGPLLGEVKRIGIRSSTIRTWQGAEVIVPNAQLISEQVINWTHSDRHRRMDIGVGVAYGTDPERVLMILVAVAREDPDVLATPEPAALFVGFGDSSLDFELRCWTADFMTYRVTQSRITVAIEAALRDADISIPFPQRDLHVVSLPTGPDTPQ